MPHVSDVVVAIAAVLVACLAGAATAHAAARGGNWLLYICTAGCAAFVAGVVGQQTFPTAATVARLGSAAAARSVPGPWDAGVSLPVVPIRVTPVAIAGVVIAAVGLSLVLLFERIPDPARPRPRGLPDLEEDDAV